MSKRIPFFAPVLLLLCAATVRADAYFTTTGTADASSTGANFTGTVVITGIGSFPDNGTSQAGVQQVSGTNNGGISFENNISTSGTPGAGNIINIIASDRIQGYSGAGGASLPNPNFGGNGTIPPISNIVPNQGVLIFAGQARVLSTTVVAGVVTASAIQIINGGLGLYSAPGTYNRTDITSWGFDGTAGKATWNLKFPAIDVGPNPNALAGAQIPPIPSAINNSASIDTINAAQNSGRLFFTDSANEPYLVNSAPEGVQLTFTQQLVSAVSGGPGANGSSETTANNIFNALDPGASGFGFADFTSAGAANYTPGSGANVTADLNAFLGISAFPLQEVTSAVITVPEPTTMALWGLAFAGAGLYRRIRRNKKK